VGEAQLLVAAGGDADEARRLAERCWRTSTGCEPAEDRRDRIGRAWRSETELVNAAGWWTGCAATDGPNAMDSAEVVVSADRRRLE
jgi:hypothetical protein